METFTKQSSVKLLDSETCIDNKVVIYKSRSKAILFILVSLLLAIAGKLFLHHPDYYVVGWSFIILSVLCLIFGIGTYFDRKPYIILTTVSRKCPIYVKKSNGTQSSEQMNSITGDNILYVF